MSNQHDIEAALRRLRLPERVILLDVNGTIYADNAAGAIDPVDLDRLKQAIRTAERTGWTVGLCSDSPLAPLQRLAQSLGMRADAPVIAENGNVVAVGDGAVMVRALPDRDVLVERITAAGARLGLRQHRPVIGPEFGGERFDRSSGFAFGDGRTTSISVFGSPDLIASLRDVAADVPDAGVDVAPESGFLAIHPLADYRTGKRMTLTLLSRQGIDVLMVGDSLSDLVPPSTGVKSAFVGNHRLPHDALDHAVFVADRPTAAGVSEILEWAAHELFGTRADWMANEVARHFEQVAADDGTSPFATPDEALAALDAVTPHQPHGYPWRSTHGHALTAPTDWQQRGPVVHAEQRTPDPATIAESAEQPGVELHVAGASVDDDPPLVSPTDADEIPSGTDVASALATTTDARLADSIERLRTPDDEHVSVLGDAAVDDGAGRQIARRDSGPSSLA